MWQQHWHLTYHCDTVTITWKHFLLPLVSSLSLISIYTLIKLAYQNMCFYGQYWKELSLNIHDSCVKSSSLISPSIILQQLHSITRFIFSLKPGNHFDLWTLAFCLNFLSLKKNKQKWLSVKDIFIIMPYKYMSSCQFTRFNC